MTSTHQIPRGRTEILAHSRQGSLWRTLDQHTNNFNAIRLLLSCLVIVTHSYIVSYGSSPNSPVEWLSRVTRGQESFGEISVDLFFVISGVFITASWFRARSMQDYFYKRILRIYPAFIIALAISAVVAVATSPEFRHSLHPQFWFGDIIQDALTLDDVSLLKIGIFAHNPLPDTGNISLWTIQKEFCCYLLVAILGMFALFKRRKLILGCSCVSWGYYTAILIFSHSKTHQHFPVRFLTYFLTGMCAWLYRDRLRFSWPIAGLMFALLVGTSRINPLFSIIFPLAGSYLTLWLGLTPPWKGLGWTDDTDLSYGVYLYAFPVQQLVAMSPSLRSVNLNICISLRITLFLAWLSRRFIEEPFLALKSRKLTDLDPGVVRSEALSE
jgi:peptidoglycan/LPS O-acetylase OafA/YrhL